MNDDSRFMKMAVSLAMQGLGRTAPNPPVGAVIVRESEVVGEGFHPKAGKPHAEIFAIGAAGDRARGATLYVTLEPCSHYGRTPPCTEAIIAAGIKRVVIGSVDPNPVVSGNGISILRSKGIDVDIGIEEDETGRLIRWYSKWMAERRPYVIVKAAMTLDGKIAASSGDSKWISSEESRRLVHGIRNHADAILVGIGTVLMDDPLLTSRIPGGRDPLKVIIDRDLIIPKTAKCLGDNTLIITSAASAERPELSGAGVSIARIELNAANRFEWKDVLDYIGGLGLHAVLVEGGSAILSDIIRAGLVDELKVFVAPKLLGGGVPIVDWGDSERIADSCRLVITGLTRVGTDVLIEAAPEA